MDIPTTRKGFWLRVMNDAGQEKDEVGINTYGEAVYRVKRRYYDKPHVGLFVGTKLVEEYEMGEKTTMATGNPFAEYAQRQNPDFDPDYPRLNQDQMATLADFEIPFRLVGGSTGTVGDFGEYLKCRIEVDVTSSEYKYVSAKKEIPSRGTISLPLDDTRQGQYENILKLHYENKPEMLLKLVGFPTKNGKVYYKYDHHSSN